MRKNGFRVNRGVSGYLLFSLGYVRRIPNRGREIYEKTQKKQTREKTKHAKNTKKQKNHEFYRIFWDGRKEN